MKYYKLLYNFENDKDAIMLNVDENILGFDRYDTAIGRRFVSWNMQLTFYYDTAKGRRITDYIANNLIWFLITEKFKVLLERHDSDSIQFLPIKVKPLKDDIGLTECYLANIVSVIDAMDFENSIYSNYDSDKSKKRLSVIRYALKESSIITYNIFRLKDGDLSIFISETLKREMRKNNISGCDFLEVKVV